MKNHLHCKYLLAIVSLGCIVCSCKKNKPAPPPPPPVTLSSEKNIIAFTIKKSLNSAYLDTTIIGVIEDTTITLTMPAETDLSNLRPSITITGASVTPDTSAVQNFANAVSYTVTAKDGTSKRYTVRTKYRSTVFIASDGGSLYSLDAKTGAIIWKSTPLRPIFSLLPGSSSSPAIGSGLVFISDYKGIYAYDAKNGSLKWSIPLNDLANGGELDPTPLYNNGTVYIGSREGAVLALNASSGSVKWKFTHPRQVSFNAPPTLVNNTLFIGCNDSALYALDANTGSLKWKFQTPFLVGSNPLFLNNTVYFPSDSTYGLDPATGSLKLKIWGDSYIGSLTGADNVLYKTNSNDIYAFDAQTGGLLWYTTDLTYGPIYNQRSSPIVADGRIFFGSLNGNVYAFSISSRSKAWQAATGKDIVSSPVVVDGLLYIGSEDNSVYAFDEAYGELKWMQQTIGPIRSSPCVVDEKGVVHYPGISGAQN